MGQSKGYTSRPPRFGITIAIVWSEQRSFSLLVSFRTCNVCCCLAYLCIVVMETIVVSLETLVCFFYWNCYHSTVQRELHLLISIKSEAVSSLLFGNRIEWWCPGYARMSTELALYKILNVTSLYAQRSLNNVTKMLFSPRFETRFLIIKALIRLSEYIRKS